MRTLLAFLTAVALIFTSSPALANGREDYIPGLDLALRRQIQTVLKQQGFYRGRIDGVIGAGSRAAIRRFRIARGIANERETFGPEYPGEGTDLTLYLTPRLIRELFGIDMGSGLEELSMREQLDLMRRLGITPVENRYRNYVDPDD